MIHPYTDLNHPLAQIAAAEEFCGNIAAYVEDEHEAHKGTEPPDVEGVHPLTILDTLARLGLRFAIGPRLSDEAYFSCRCLGSLVDQCLHAYAKLVANDLEENSVIMDCGQDMVLELVTLHGCVTENLIFVPDYDGVASAAYFLGLSPGDIPTERPNGGVPDGRS